MAIQPSPTPPQAATAPRRTPEPHRFTVDDYYAFARAGILEENARVELIEGVVYAMSPIGIQHCRVIDDLNAFFMDRRKQRYIVRIQSAVQFSQYTQVQPDVALLKWTEDRYGSAHPGPSDILLIIEVADATLDYDLGGKADLYAQAGVSDYWVFDLQRSELVVHRDPADGAYKTRRVCTPKESVTPLALSDVALNLTEMFGS